MTSVVEDFATVAWEAVQPPCEGSQWVIDKQHGEVRECEHPATWVMWLQTAEGGPCPKCATKQSEIVCAGHLACDGHFSRGLERGLYIVTARAMAFVKRSERLS